MNITRTYTLRLALKDGGGCEREYMPDDLEVAVDDYNYMRNDEDVEWVTLWESTRLA